MSYEELVMLKHPCRSCTDKCDGCKKTCFYLFTYKNTYRKYMSKINLYKGYTSIKEDKKNKLRISGKMTRLRSNK